MNDRITITVPIFNVAKFLERAIDSILEQTYKDLEIILVDDGSSDICGSICDTYAFRDSRIKVIHKRNGGLSSARNAGISATEGNYIAFVDSDDIISRHYVERLYSVAKKDDYDIVQCDFFRFSEKIPIEAHSDSYTAITKEEALKKIDTPYYMAAWNKLYKRILFLKNRFPEGKIHEDVGCTYKLFIESKAIANIPDKLYGYFENPDSITTSKIKLNKLDLIDIYLEQITYFVQRNLQKNAANSANNLASCFGTLLSYKIDRYYDYDEFYAAIQKKFRQMRPILLKCRLRADLYLAVLFSFGNVKIMKYYHKIKTHRKR